MVSIICSGPGVRIAGCVPSNTTQSWSDHTVVEPLLPISGYLDVLCVLLACGGDVGVTGRGISGQGSNVNGFCIQFFHPQMCYTMIIVEEVNSLNL